MLSPDVRGVRRRSARALRASAPAETRRGFALLRSLAKPEASRGGSAQAVQTDRPGARIRNSLPTPLKGRRGARTPPAVGTRAMSAQSEVYSEGDQVPEGRRQRSGARPGPPRL